MDCEAVKRLSSDKNEFSRHVGIEVVDVGPGPATCVMPVRAEEPSAGNHMATYAVRITGDSSVHIPARPVRPGIGAGINRMEDVKRAEGG